MRIVERRAGGRADAPLARLFGTTHCRRLVGRFPMGRSNPCYVYHVVTVDYLLMHYTGGLPGELAGQ
jgi:hypothetical protein